MRSRCSRTIKALLVAVSVALLVVGCMQQAARTPPTITSSETPDPPAARVSDSAFDKFSHEVAEHKQFECVSCHRRETKQRELEFAGHDSCVGCHLNQFISPERAMCAICHDKLEANPPTVRSFPVRFREGFNMKFDHTAHDNGEGRPAAGCAHCHAPAGAGKSIPAGIQAHNNCFSCHTPESKIGTCNVCHELAPYSRTPQSRYVFRAVFTHGDHAGVGCGDCHSVRPGPQGRQVTNIVAQEHNNAPNSCATCHNGSRAFSGNDPMNFSSCARCHKGSGFDMLPGSGQ